MATARRRGGGPRTGIQPGGGAAGRRAKDRDTARRRSGRPKPKADKQDGRKKKDRQQSKSDRFEKLTVVLWYWVGESNSYCEIENLEY